MTRRQNNGQIIDLVLKADREWQRRRYFDMNDAELTRAIAKLISDCMFLLSRNDLEPLVDVRIVRVAFELADDGTFVFRNKRLRQLVNRMAGKLYDATYWYCSQNNMDRAIKAAHALDELVQLIAA